MAQSEDSTTFEQFVARLGLAIGLIVFGFQLTAGASIAGAVVKAFVSSLGVQATMLLGKVCVIFVMRMLRGSTARIVDNTETPKKPAADKPESQTGSARKAA
ncbi:MAG: hypothetical protein KDD65_15480 [Bacteroidetes bacterium]|nr:hypothetical protein [Bacteroidota bacterium]